MAAVTEASELDVLGPAVAQALPAAPELPALAVERLPRGELGIPERDDDPFWRLVAAFLIECRREQTRRAYFNDLRAWYAWCTDRELHPLAARRHDVALWARRLANTPQRSGKTEAPASIARRLSCLSSFYGYGVEVDVLEDNPVANVKRPRVPNASMSVGLARDELEALLDAAHADGPRSEALLTLLAYNGLRIDEALSRDIEHLGHQFGHRVLRISRKGGRDALEPLSPPVERALDRHLAGRTTGPLFPDDQGRRMYGAQAWRLARRLARKAGIKSAGQTQPTQPAPHLRHQPRPRRRTAPRHPGRHGPRRPANHPPLHGQPPARHATYAFAAWLRRSADAGDQAAGNDDRLR